MWSLMVGSLMGNQPEVPKTELLPEEIESKRRQSIAGAKAANAIRAENAKANIIRAYKSSAKRLKTEWVPVEEIAKGCNLKKQSARELLRKLEFAGVFAKEWHCKDGIWSFSWRMV